MAGNGHVYVREGRKAKAAWAYGGTPLANLTSARVRAKAKARLACLRKAPLKGLLGSDGEADAVILRNSTERITRSTDLELPAGCRASAFFVSLMQSVRTRKSRAALVIVAREGMYEQVRVTGREKKRGR